MLSARRHDGTQAEDHDIYSKIYKCCRRAVMTAQAVICFPLKDIAKLNTYCKARPYSHMCHVNVPTRRHGDVL